MDRVKLFVVNTVVLSCLVVGLFLSTVAAQTSSFTYQGKLTDGAVPATGIYEMQFSLWDAVNGGTQHGSTITNSTVGVSNGIFTVDLDFALGPFSTGADRWLEIAVRKSADPPGFTTLSPRQPITSAPYSIRTRSASASDSLSGACVSCVTDAHVSDVITVGPGGTVNSAALPATVMRTTGSTMTGDLVLAGDPVSNLSAVTKQYVDSADALKLNLSGGTMTDTLSMGNNVILNIGNAGTDFSGTGGLTLADRLTVNNGAATNSVYSETGIDRSSAASETFNIQNSGTGTMTLQVDGANVINTGNLSLINSVGTITSGTWNGTSISVANGGTGSTSAPGARANLGAAASGANSDITSLSGLTAPLSVGQGGTGSATQNFVDLSTTQTVAGNKTFSSALQVTASPGNDSVILPNNAISAAETLDEPGVASASGTTFISLNGTVQTILSRQITVPATGYVLAIGTVSASIGHSGGGESRGQFGISAAVGSFPANQQVVVELRDLGTSGIDNVPVTVHGLFSVASAGTFTFYLLGQALDGDDIDVNGASQQLTLLYVPTSYGTVQPTLPGGAAGASGSEAPSSGKPVAVRNAPPAGVVPTLEEFKRQQAEIEDLKHIVCALKPDAPACTQESE